MSIAPILGCHLWPDKFAIHLSLLASRHADFEYHVRLYELCEFADRAIAEPGTPRAQILDCWREICSLTDVQRAQQHREILKKARRQAEMYREISARLPEFGGPHCAADYTWWAKYSVWTVDEAVALALGMDPRQVTWPDVDPHVEDCALAAKFRDYRALVIREQSAGNLAEELAPADFIEWAKDKFELPQELVEAVVANGTRGSFTALREEIAQLKKENADLSARPDTRRLNTLRRVLIGMGTHHYGYDPEQAQNSTARRMSEDLRNAGYAVGDDTLRNALREASEEVSREL